MNRRALLSKIMVFTWPAMLLCFFSTSAASQISSVTTTQNFNFGSFYPGSNGGTVTISPNSTRSSTGDVVLLNQGTPCSQAIFEIEAPAGTIVTITNGPDAILKGSNGGSLTLHIDDSDPIAPITTTANPPATTSVSFGATLSVGSASTTVPGSYNGTFSIIFNNQ